MAELSKDNLLRSWKEIAAYLRCDVRTCHRWETDRGMPIHRAEGGEKKSPVFAHKDELDRWFQGTFKNSSHHSVKNAAALNWLKWVARVAILLAPGRAVFPLLGRPRPEPAGGFHDRRVFSSSSSTNRSASSGARTWGSRTSNRTNTTGRTSR